jgi:hypothetical protein
VRNIGNETKNQKKKLVNARIKAYNLNTRTHPTPPIQHPPSSGWRLAAGGWRP